MNDETLQFALTGRDAEGSTPVLTKDAVGKLDAVLLDFTLRQTYRNTGLDALEVIYSFPLPPAAVLLGFAAEFDGRRLDGTITAKREAEQHYEDALVQGHTPVLLEYRPDGLHTANIGRLAPDEEIVLEVRFAQTLTFEQGRLRISIPTTIAPRFGDPGVAGLQPQQVPPASLRQAIR